jgi:hypothetical protein
MAYLDDRRDKEGLADPVIDFGEVRHSITAISKSRNGCDQLDRSTRALPCSGARSS